MWTKLRLRNWRCFEDTGEMELAPLTVLIGPNSGGKSSILKAFLVLRQTVEERDPEVTLVTRGEGWDVGTYADYVFRGDKQRRIRFDLEWVPRRFGAPTLGRGTGRVRPVWQSSAVHPPHCLRVAWGLRGRPPRAVVLEASSLMADLHGAVLHPVLRLRRSRGESYTASSGSSDLSRLENPSRDYRPRRSHQAPRELLDRLPAEVAGRQRNLEYRFHEELTATAHLSPVRAEAERIYPAGEATPSDVGPDGARVWEVLRMGASEEAAGARAQLSEWVDRIGLAKAVSVVGFGDRHYSIVVTDRAGHSANLADAGGGVPYVVPLLVQGLAGQRGSTLLVEQPEIELNPRMQANLGDFMVYLVRKRRQQLIIETHSQHLLSRLRTLVVREELPPDQLAVYYCDLTADGARAQRLDVDRLGRFEEWPDGFFEEELREAITQTDELFRRSKAKERR